MSQQPPLWALLVAIDTYSDAIAHPPVGAIVDSQEVSKYLTAHMKIPEDHIISLNNSNATRSRIISIFQEHLIDNPKIEKGDAILFYYSGHGSYMKAPPGWTIVAGVGDDSDGMVEVILPYDESLIDPETGHRIHAIPDRTLAALIDLAAARHGDNITVVLDCCSSGHGTRADRPVLFRGEPLVSRYSQQESLTSLPPDLDHDLVSRDHTQGLTVEGVGRRGRLKALGTNHVLLAACRSREQAQGTVEHGGLLTSLWLSFMRKGPRPRTYAAATNFIGKYLKGLYDDGKLLGEQHPQCEGDVRERIIFEETMIKADHFNATTPRVVTSSGTEFQFEVEAGEIHGVEKGTEFEIYGLDGDLKDKKLGTAIATRVDGRSSIVETRQLGDQKGLVTYSAVIVHKPTLNYHVVVDSQTSSDVSGAYPGHSTWKMLSEALEKVRSECVEEITDPDDVALEVRVEVDGTVTLRRLDKLMHQLRNITPRIERDSLKHETLLGIFRGIARFNHFLPLTNRKHPLVDKVSLEMRRLLKQGETNGVFPVRILSEVVPVDDLTKERTVTDSDDYAIILHNDSNVDLYVQIWYFDPDEYSITPLYRSANVTQATLPEGGELQIGASTELPWPLTYYVPEGAQIATMFAKIFLTDGPVKLRSLQQNPLIGPDASGRNPGEGKLELETKGLWDTMLFPITVVKTPGDSK